MGKPKTSRRPQPRKSQGSEKQEGLNPRQALFEQFYRQGGPEFPPGNAYRSAIAAGYTPITAKANCHILARKCNIKTAEALIAMGCDGFSQAKKLLTLREAKTVKWNPDKFPGRRATKKRAGTFKHGGWDLFEDSSTQLDATKEINRILDSYPAPKQPTEPVHPVTIIWPSSFKSVALQKE